MQNDKCVIQQTDSPDMLLEFSRCGYGLWYDVSFHRKCNESDHALNILPLFKKPYH